MVMVWPKPQSAPMSAGFGKGALAAHDGGDRDDVVGVRGMAHAEKEPDHQNGESADHGILVAYIRSQHRREDRLDASASITLDGTSDGGGGETNGCHWGARSS